jgi:hypothetical protein
VRGKSGGRGKGGEMTQTLYAHVNKIKIKIKFPTSKEMIFKIKRQPTEWEKYLKATHWSKG